MNDPASAVVDGKSLIGTMFEIIDARRWNELGNVFGDDCVYERPGFAKISGLEALCAFYRDERPIECGIHRVDMLVVEEGKVCAAGRFVGFLRDGTDVSVRFSDTYRLRDGRVVWRCSYFFTPLV